MRDRHHRVRGGNKFRAGLFHPGFDGRVAVVQIISADHGVFDSARANLFRGILREKRFDAPRPVGFPERDIEIVAGAHEADDFEAGRKPLADAGERVGAICIDLVNFLRAQ